MMWAPARLGASPAAALALTLLLLLLPAAAVAAAGGPPGCREMGCGRRSSDACWCDPTCYSHGNCCADYGAVCPRAHPRLQLGDVNLVVTTDLHSWIEGRSHEGYLNATLGHTVSLVERLRALARTARRDIFFFDNGDINDGTGLSATGQDHVAYLAPLMRLAPYDALNIGNHELYQLNSRGAIPGEACAVTGLRDTGYISAWAGRYLTSNTVWATSREPVGSRYATLVGEFGTRLLVFGFLYNMDDHCDAVVVEDVNATVHAAWFLDALREHAPSSDAIVVLAHMDYRDELVDLILKAIRASVGDEKAVQFLTGHSHVRGSRILDAYASSYEAGCKMDTVGFVSFTSVATPPLRFHQVDLDGNTASLAEAANTTEAQLLAPQGRIVNTAIAAMQAALGLRDVLGCADRHYRVTAGLDESDSLWAYFMGRVLPGALLAPKGAQHQWAVLGTSALTYDVYEGPFTRDDAYKASPYGNFWFSVPGVGGSAIQTLLARLNHRGQKERHLGPLQVSARLPRFAGGRTFSAAHWAKMPEYLGTGPTEASVSYEVIYCDFDARDVEGLLRNITGKDVRGAIYRAGSNTSSVLADWFWQQPCPSDGYIGFV